MIKVRSIILSILLICPSFIYADELSNISTQTSTQPSRNSDAFRRITPELLYSYTDFNFDSNRGVNRNSFQGHSNLYSAGADHISFGSSVFAGLYYFRVNTAVSSQFLLAPRPLAIAEQTIKNNTIFGHILKNFTPKFSVDVAGGYGQNKLTTFAQIQQDAGTTLLANALNNNENWFFSLNGIYKKEWQKFIFRANLGLLYSLVGTGNYYYFLPAINEIQKVQHLSNKATLIMENAELGYLINPKLRPFINGGLIQVVHFSNSRDIINPLSIINGSLPQLNMNKNGFRLGGGISYIYKNLTMRIEEKYYNAGGTFQSYQTLAALKYRFS